MENTVRNESWEKIGNRVDEAVEISKNTKNFKQGWEELKKIQKELKELDAPKEIKDQLWIPLKLAFNRLKEREKEYFKELRLKQNENYQMLKPLVDKASKIAKEGKNFKEIRKELISVQKKFKGLSLPKEKHQALWDILQESFNILKKREEELYEAQKEKWEENYNFLKEKVSQAKDIAQNYSYFKEAWEKINEIKDLFLTIKTDKEREKLLLDELSEYISILKKRQEERKKEIEKIKEAGFDKLNRLCNRALNEAKTNKNLKELFNRLKTWQKDIFTASKYLDSQEEKDILKNKIDEAFSIYKKRQDDHFKEKREEWLKKQTDFLEKMISKKEYLSTVTIPKIKDSIKNSEEYLEKLKNELDNPENNDENNKKTEFLNNKIKKVKNEIEEKKNSIPEIEKKIEEISQTIQDVQEKIKKAQEN